MVQPALKTLSDNTIREEYKKRFMKQAGQRLKSSGDSAEHLRAYFDQFPQDREHFVAIFMNTQNRIISTELMSSGTLSTATVFPREIVKRLLALEAGAIIVAHNHPSGELLPSSSDKAITRKLQKALESIDVAFLDHIVIGAGYYSFADQGLL